MDAIFSIAQELSNGSPTVERAIERIVDRKRDSCPRSLSQVQRRLYAAANWVWHEIHHQLPVPLSPHYGNPYPPHPRRLNNVSSPLKKLIA